LPEADLDPAQASHGEGVADALAALAGLQMIDLGQPMTVGMPQSPNHPQFRMALQRRHGDMVRADGSSAANEIIVTGGHVGTHIDALAHVSYRGRLHGDVDAHKAQAGGRFSQLGVETIEPMINPGVLLDVPGALGIDRCPPGYEVTPEDLQRALGRQDSRIQAGDVILIRTGWGQLFSDPDAFVGRSTGVPGPGSDAGDWLAAYQPRAVGSDTLAFEHIPPGEGHALLPVHRLLLVQRGVHIIETLALERLAASAGYQFVLVLVPLPITGATGSPVRPLALCCPRQAVIGHG
jgi:kynurenine formamidase